MIHDLYCRPKRRWLRYRWNIPYWREDKVAQMLGIAAFGCPRCGRGAVEEAGRPCPYCDQPRTAHDPICPARGAS